eukprot:359454-Pleurochrysis_carterae.AAC.3
MQALNIVSGECGEYSSKTQSAQMQIRRRVAACHFLRTTHDVAASVSAAKFDTHPPSPGRQATDATKSEMK